MIMHPNLRRKIMITFKMDSSIARAVMTICIYFISDVIMDRRVGLDYLKVGLRSRLGGTSIPKRWNGRANILKIRV
jgi:hypothetical protein